MNFFLLCITASLFLFSCNNSSNNNDIQVAPKGKDPAEVSGRPGDCKEFISSLPSDYFYNWIEVPENPNDITSPTLKIFYYGKNTNAPQKAIFFNGGPGSDSHGNHRGIENALNKNNILNQVDLIYMDQRGTGCSSAYPEGSAPQIFDRYIHYGSRGIVYDAEAIRSKIMGNRPWIVYGQSYGAFIIHRYVTLFPQSILKAVAHANTITSSPQQRLDYRIFSQYRVWQEYFKKYPEDRIKMSALKKYLTKNLCFVDQFNNETCGLESVSTMTSLLGFSYTWETIHQDFSSLVDAQNEVQNKNLIKYINEYAEEDFNIAPYATSVISYYDRNVLSADMMNCSRAIERIKIEFQVDAEADILTECSSGLQFEYVSKMRDKLEKYFNGKNDHLTLDNFKNGLLGMTDSKKFFLFSGQLDSFVPVESFKEEINSVGSMITYQHFSNSGHEGFRSESDVIKKLGL